MEQSSITEKIKQALSDSYDPDTVCVYYLEWKNEQGTEWRAEVEAYVDVEDGPYFFIFERRGSRLFYWINEAKRITNED